MAQAAAPAAEVIVGGEIGVVAAGDRVSVADALMKEFDMLSDDDISH